MSDDAVAEPTWQEVVRYAQRGECWVCGRTGFKKLSQHLAMKHGLTADAVRERYGLAWRQALCSPEFSDENRARFYENDLTSAMAAGRGPGRRPPRSRKSAQVRAAMSEVANRPEVREKLAARNRDSSYNEKRAAGLRSSPAAAAQRAAARQASAETRRVVRHCTICGAPCLGRNRRTCSDDCRLEARVRQGQSKRRDHPCVVCGARVQGSERRTCSFECAREAQRRAARATNERR